MYMLCFYRSEVDWIANDRLGAKNG